MLYAEQGTSFVLRLEQGDDILKTLKQFADSQKIRAAFFEGIGSLYKARLGHYDFKDTRTYKYETFDEDLEILTLSGNVSTMNQQALPHAQGTYLHGSVPYLYLCMDQIAYYEQNPERSTCSH